MIYQSSFDQSSSDMSSMDWTARWFQPPPPLGQGHFCLHSTCCKESLMSNYHEEWMTFSYFLITIGKTFIMVSFPTWGANWFVIVITNTVRTISYFILKTQKAFNPNYFVVCLKFYYFPFALCITCIFELIPTISLFNANLFPIIHIATTFARVRAYYVLKFRSEESQIRKM